MSQEDIESRVYSTMSTEQGFQLYDLTQKMKFQAENYQAKPSYAKADMLADTVLEFLKVSSWTRS